MRRRILIHIKSHGKGSYENIIPKPEDAICHLRESRAKGTSRELISSPSTSQEGPLWRHWRHCDVTPPAERRTRDADWVERKLVSIVNESIVDAVKRKLTLIVDLINRWMSKFWMSAHTDHELVESNQPRDKQLSGRWNQFVRKLRCPAENHWTNDQGIKWMLAVNA